MHGEKDEVINLSYAEETYSALLDGDFNKKVHYHKL